MSGRLINVVLVGLVVLLSLPVISLLAGLLMLLFMQAACFLFGRGFCS